MKTGGVLDSPLFFGDWWTPSTGGYNNGKPTGWGTDFHLFFAHGDIYSPAEKESRVKKIDHVQGAKSCRWQGQILEYKSY